MRALSVALLAFLVLACAVPVRAQTAQALEVKAAFLFKFGDFVEWPSASLPEGRPFAIGVIDAPAMAAELERITAGRTVQGRPVEVRQLARDAALDAVHVLFIGAAAAPHLERILAGAQGLAVLTVTETEGAMVRGSMINFVAADARIRFDVALAPAERSHLRISARLLGVARRVVTS